MQRVEKDEYPIAAVREMILNALVHRDYMGTPTQIRLYETNFRIWNDGSLPEGITEEDLKTIHSSKPRNPLLADVCFRAGYIGAWGRGTLKIIEACKENSLPEPVLKEEQGGFLSKITKDRFSADRLKKMGLNERQIKAFVFLRENGKITNSDYQKLNEVSKKTASRDMANLTELGLLVNSGVPGAGSYYILNQ